MKNIITLVLLCTVMFTTGCFKNNDTSKNEEENQKDVNKKIVNEAAVDEYIGSIKDLIEKGEPVKCVLNWNEEGKDLKSIYYIHKERMRLNVEMSGNSDIMTHTIIDDKSMYSWNDKEKVGTKIVFDDASDVKSMDEEDPFMDKEINKNFKCEKWTIDESKFTVPTDVNFIDFENQFEGLGDSLKSLKMPEGEVCQKCGLEKNSKNKEKCLNSMGCN